MGQFIPEDALGLSARILTEHLNLFTNLTEIAIATDVMKEVDTASDDRVLERTSKNWIFLFVHITV